MYQIAITKGKITDYHYFNTCRELQNLLDFDVEMTIIITKYDTKFMGKVK